VVPVILMIVKAMRRCRLTFSSARAIRITGTTPDRVILGFMIATAFLSMWISNTATTVVMLPIALSVIQLLIDDEDGFTRADRNFALSIMLGIAYAANIGGIATIIGTPPNTVMAGFVENEYGIQLSFLNWMVMGIPFSSFMLGLAYWIMVKWIYPNGLGSRRDSRQLIQRELEKLGPIQDTEKRVIIIFVITMLLWITRTYLNEWLDFLTFSDAGISMLAAFSLFAIPFRFNQGEFSLRWEDTKKLPWGILILFGGGLALASAMSEAGLIKAIGEAVSQNASLSLLLVGALLIAIMLFATELMSNVALVAVTAPMIAGIAMGLDMNMLHLLIPVAMASSCAFMLPMATPPNAIVFASGYIKVAEMARAGFLLNLISIALLVGFFQFVIPLLF
ncbi:MAG: DASS family sodium-coupled anion symporter, partial [Bacteroidota bacterium]